MLDTGSQSYASIFLQYPGWALLIIDGNGWEEDSISKQICHPVR